MTAPVTDAMRDPRTPDDVDVRSSPRTPVDDPTLGIPVTFDSRGTPAHRLVAIGDSITHGMQSGAVFATDLSYPAIAAHTMGWSGLRRPTYGDMGGLPLNIEWLLRDLERRFGDDVDWWETPLALVRAREFLDRVEDYWERGPGSTPPTPGRLNHVLAVYGWDLRDALTRTAGSYLRDLSTPRDDLLDQLVQDDTARAALRVLPSEPAHRRSMVAPIARGVREKVRSGSRYFPYYTRPWISDDEFEPARDPHLTAQQARAVDSAIDQYNAHIETVVRDARREGRDWLLLDVAGLLDRLASRRYVEDPRARPDWWRPYVLPPELAALDLPPDSRFVQVADGRRVAGGLFSLDGVHPATVAAGILAQELLNVMCAAGVRVRPDGPGPAQVDFARLVRRDTLLTAPPATLRSGLRILGWADACLDLFSRVLPR